KRAWRFKELSGFLGVSLKNIWPSLGKEIYWKSRKAIPVPAYLFSYFNMLDNLSPALPLPPPRL
ncbi:MAG: hypothetical protein LBF22_10840, partial [Deltaproteobacteria bacterium]|nr:hypothetical protein [Deltaproteobacteria bacterium]